MRAMLSTAFVGLGIIIVKGPSITGKVKSTKRYLVSVGIIIPKATSATFRIPIIVNQLSKLFKLQ